MSVVAAIIVGAIIGLALGIVISVTTDVPLAPEIGLVLGPIDHVPSERKLRAAQAITGRLGLTLGADQVVRSAYSLESGQAAGNRLLRAGVTGIVCASDPLALGVIRAARRAGLRVPGDVSVVGYDDSAFMSCTEPPLTTVRQPIELMGRAAIELLVSQIHGGAVPQDELLFEPELVVRGSTGPAPVRPVAVAG